MQQSPFEVLVQTRVDEVDPLSNVSRRTSGGENCCPDFRGGSWSPHQLSDFDRILFNLFRKLNAGDRHRCSIESLESKHRADPLFNPAMVLFDDIVQVFLNRIRTRRGTVPVDLSSAIALCDAAYASSVTTCSVPLFSIALRKKRFAAATSRRSLNRKSMVQPRLSTARYKYVHRPFTLI
jgi:hypothetical protein